MSPITHPVLDTFLLGFIAASSLFAGIFFLRFWRETRDSLFLAFSAFFLIQSVLSAVVLDLPEPNEGTPWIFTLRLVSVAGVLGAILGKNAGS